MCVLAVGVAIHIHTLLVAGSIVIKVLVQTAVVQILNLSQSQSSTHIVKTFVQLRAKASCGSQSAAEFDI
jgi:hypothetical protein